VKRLRERWRKLPRLARWPLALVFWLAFLRLALAALLPLAAGWYARSHGFEVDWQRLSIALRSGQLELRGLSLAPRAEDGPPADPWLRLERLFADVALGDLLRGELRLQRLELDGLDLRWERRADGSIPWLEKFAASAEPDPPEEPPSSEPQTFVAPLKIDRLRASQLVLHVVDAALPGGSDLRLVANLRAEDVGYAERQGTLRAQFSIPGALERLQLDAVEHSSAEVAALDLALELRGFDPVPLAGYLASLGLAPDARRIEGRAKLALELRPSAPGAHSLAAQLELSEFVLERDGAQALGLERARLALAELGPGIARGIGVELAGLSLRARRNSAGETCFAGLRQIPVVAKAAEGGSGSTRWSLAGISLERIELEMLDESAAQAAPLALQIDALRLGAFDPASTGQRTGFEALAHLPGRVRDLELRASFERMDAQCKGDFALQARELTLPQAAPIELVCEGRMELARGADGVWTGGGSAGPLRVDGANGLQRATLEGLRADPAATALSIAKLELSGLDGRLPRALLAPLGIEVGWKEARLAAQLDAALVDGKLSAHVRALSFADGEQRYAAVDEIGFEGWNPAEGLSQLGTLRVNTASCEAARDDQGVLHVLGLRIAPPAPAAPVAQPGPVEVSFPALPKLGWSAIEVEGAALHWTDRAQGRAVDLALTSRLHFGALVPGKPAQFRAELTAPGALESLVLEGQATLAPERVELEGRFEARGLAPNLGGMLPPGLALRSSDDVLACGFRASAEPAGALALKAGLELTGFAWGAPGEAARASFERAALELPLVSGTALEIGELSLRGLRVAAAKSADGSQVLGGLRLTEVPAAPADAGAPAAKAPAGEPPPLPRITLGKFELDLAGLELRDETLAPDAAPLVLVGAFATEAPLVLADAAPEALPALEFVLRGSVAPLVQKVEVHVALKQWLVQPLLDVHVLAQGVRGQALVELDPGLAARIDGSGLAEGEIEARLSGSFAFARRGVGRFDLARPFSAELALEDLVLRASPGGEVLAGLEKAEVSLERVDLRTGSLRAKSIEFTRPLLRAERTPEGISFCGLLLRKPSAAAEDAPATAPKEAAAEPLARPEPLPEISIARVSASGLDVLLTDRTVEPPVRTSLVDLELELRGISTRALTEPRSVLFNASLRAGPVELPPHGAVKKASEHELFGDLELSGRAVLFPEPALHFRLGLEDLELVHYRALAAQQGVRVEDGRLDLAVKGRFTSKRGLMLDTVTVLSEIDVSETDNGPIQGALGLPMTAQAALVLVRDIEGNVRLPVRVELPPGEISKTAIVQAVLESASAILMRAIMSSPFRVVGGLAGSVGLDVAGGRGGVEELVFACDEGSAQPEGLVERELLQLAGKLSADDRIKLVLEHSFSQGDLERARVLANPDLEDCRELSRSLRQKKAELARERAEGAARVRVDLAVGRTREASAGTERLREIDAELGHGEAALDRVHEILAQDSERNAERRLRNTARALANQRLEKVRAALLGVGIDPGQVHLKGVRITAGEAPRGSVHVRIVRER